MSQLRRICLIGATFVVGCSATPSTTPGRLADAGAIENPVNAPLDAGPIDNGAGRLALAPAASSGAPREDDAGQPQSCAQAEYEAKLRPLDMLVVLDQSGSMTEHDDRWTPVTQALVRFVSSSDAAGMGVALQYFPLGEDDDEKCDPDSYAEPDVPMAPLPENAQPITDSIAAHYFDKANCCDAPQHKGTPTKPAVSGGVDYLKRWLKQHADHSAALLLATDGEPSDVCDDNEISDVAKVIEAAAKGSPAIPSYVVGIGDEDGLQDLAAAGGTGLGALLVDGSGKNTERELLDALGKIRARALSCEFALPEAAGSDPDNVAIEVAGGKAGTQSLGRVPSKEGCAKTTAPAFYAMNTGLALCPDTCSSVMNQAESQLRIIVGCRAPDLL
jgi:hypothetical protein